MNGLYTKAAFIVQYENKYISIKANLDERSIDVKENSGIV